MPRFSRYEPPLLLTFQSYSGLLAMGNVWNCNTGPSTSTTNGCYSGWTAANCCGIGCANDGFSTGCVPEGALYYGPSGCRNGLEATSLCVTGTSKGNPWGCTSFNICCTGAGEDGSQGQCANGPSHYGNCITGGYPCQPCVSQENACNPPIS